MSEGGRNIYQGIKKCINAKLKTIIGGSKEPTEWMWKKKNRNSTEIAFVRVELMDHEEQICLTIYC